MKRDHPPETYKDPVCGMEVSQKTAPATAEFEGKTYYFCAEACRDAFVAEPKKYLGHQKKCGEGPDTDIGLKEIKAYVRPELLETVIRHLEEAGAKDITVIRVDALGNMADYEKDRGRFLRKYAEKYSKTAKLEIVCRDEQVDKLVTIIQEAGRLGESGDGRVFVGNIEKAANIRTGETGRKAI